MTDTNTQIARVVTDLRLGRFANLSQHTAKQVAAFAALSNTAPIINATAIYDSIMAKHEPVYIYEDHPCIAPPWDSAVISYVNAHGNVNCMIVATADKKRGDPTTTWETDNEIDWDRVRWEIHVAVFVGGLSPVAGHIPTSGPVIFYSWAVYEDGAPADLHWFDILESGDDPWNNCALVTLAVLNFMNCRNVTLVEPKMERAERRRLDREGVKMNILSVYPAGLSSRSTSRRDDPLGIPLSTVTGHFASYGAQYGRGLLFGKYEGRFWIPMHARGSKEHGMNVNDYDLKPDDPQVVPTL